MKSKVLEVRDEGTHIPVAALLVMGEDPIEDYYIHYRCGYPHDLFPTVVLVDLGSGRGMGDPAGWPSAGYATRTLPVAHQYVADNFAHLKSGDVVDVQFILGETTVKKQPERPADWSPCRV